MLTQTLAIFRDAYRELNSKRLFWITLILSALFMAAFGLLGVKGEDKLTLLTFEFDVPMAAFQYKQIFNWVVLWLWLTVAAIVLALISTGGIFPEFITSGSIDLFVSKPMSRLRLFFTKYLAGLLFVLLQVTVFSVASFVVLGLRAGEWKPGLFFAIPLVVTFFSYLFAICVLFGVLTRSTIAALLLTILIWCLLFALHKAEELVLTVKSVAQLQVDRSSKAKADAEADLATLRANPPDSQKLVEARGKAYQDRLEKANDRLEDSEPTLRKLTLAHNIIYGAKTVLPKTSETTNILDRLLFSDDEIAAAMKQDEQAMKDARFGDPDAAEQFELMHAAGRDTVTKTRARSPAWIIGTSLGFESVVLVLAAWAFCRRDY